MAKKVWSPERNRKLLEMYESRKFPTSEMADVLEVSVPTVYNHLRRMGLPTEKILPRRPRAAGKVELSDEGKLRMIRLAAEDRKLTEIALILKMTIGPTRRIFRELGLKTSIYKPIVPGKRFGALTVIGPADPVRTYKGHFESRSEVQCRCGQTKIILNSNLRSGNTSSCGCGYQKKRPDRDWVRRRCDVESGARTRNLDMLLTTGQVKYLGMQNCAYCGAPPGNGMRGRKKGRSTGEIVLPYNGIDRVDPAVGYRSGNVVPCCLICNQAKSDLKLSKFVAWLNRFGSRLSVQCVLDLAANIGSHLESITDRGTRQRHLWETQSSQAAFLD